MKGSMLPAIIKSGSRPAAPITLIGATNILGGSSSSTHTITLSSANITTLGGLSRADRVIFIWFEGLSGTARTYNSVTVGGVTATSIGNPSGNTSTYDSFFVAKVPNISATNVVIRYSGTRPTNGTRVHLLALACDLVSTSSIATSSGTMFSDSMSTLTEPLPILSSGALHVGYGWMVNQSISFTGDVLTSFRSIWSSAATDYNPNESYPLGYGIWAWHDQSSTPSISHSTYSVDVADVGHGPYWYHNYGAYV